MISEKSLHRQKCTVWYIFWTRGIVDTSFFENSDAKAVSDHGDGCTQIVGEFCGLILMIAIIFKESYESRSMLASCSR